MASVRRDAPSWAPQGGQAKPSGRVTAVLCAAFDPDTDRAVLAVREVVRQAGVSLPDVPPHRPHLSLAAARVDASAGLDAVVAAGAELAAKHFPIPLRLGRVGRFGRAGALWLGPAGKVAALDQLQRDADATLVGRGWPRAFGEHSEPSSWVAHCTLATRVPKPQLRAVQAAVQSAYEPIEAVIDAVAVILVGGRDDIAHLPLG